MGKAYLNRKPSRVNGIVDLHEYLERMQNISLVGADLGIR